MIAAALCCQVLYMLPCCFSPNPISHRVHTSVLSAVPPMIAAALCCQVIWQIILMAVAGRALDILNDTNP